MDKLICTPKEAAELVNTSQQEVRKWCESGELAAYRQGVNWKIPVKALDQYINARADSEASERLSKALQKDGQF